MEILNAVLFCELAKVMRGAGGVHRLHAIVLSKNKLSAGNLCALELSQQAQ